MASRAFSSPGQKALVLVCLCALISFAFAGCSDPKDFSTAANIGDLLRYSVDSGSLAYSYEILESDHGLGGTTRSGALLPTGTYTYVPQDDPTRTLMVFPDTLVVGHMTLPVQEDGVFFAGVPATEGSYGVEDIPGAYNWTGYSCGRALVDGECPEPYHSSFGTLRIREDGTADRCVGGNVDDPSGHPCQTLDTLDWTDAGNGLIALSLGGVPYATGMLHVAGGAEKVLAMALRNRPEGGYPGADRGPGIAVGVNKFAVPPASVPGLYLGAESGILLGEEDYYLKLLLRPDDTYLLAVVDLYLPDDPLYFFQGDLVLNEPWEGWIAQEDPGTDGYQQDFIAMVLPESGVLFAINTSWQTCFFAGGRLPSACTDADGDDYFVEAGCLLPTDCDDTNPDVYPGAAEACENGIDDDCDGLIDGEDPNCWPCTDGDGDGYYLETYCPAPLDCDDANPDVNPGESEDCGNGIDDDCDGLVDGADLGDCFQTTSTLPDTGMTQCSDMAGWIECPGPGEPCYGQDAQYVTNPMSYTDNLDGTVTDDVTGLMWQQEDDDLKRYKADAILYCEDLTLGGHTDWRLPDILELQGIVHYDKAGNGPCIDTVAFPGTEEDYYWTSPILPDGLWRLDFRLGEGMRSSDDDMPLYVRCVRGEPMNRSFFDNGDGTVTDDATGLVWQQTADTVSRDWEESLAYCQDLFLAGHSDWRLPDTKELASLLAPSRPSPFIDPVFAGSTAHPYWSSSTSAVALDCGRAVAFYSGNVYGIVKWFTFRARCVRQ